MNRIAIYNKCEKIRNLIQSEFRDCVVYATIKFVDDVSFGKLHPIIFVSVFDLKFWKFYDSFYLANITLNKEQRNKLLNQ